MTSEAETNFKIAAIATVLISSVAAHFLMQEKPSYATVASSPTSFAALVVACSDKPGESDKSALCLAHIIGGALAN